MLLALLLLLLPASAAERPCGKDMEWRTLTGVLWDLRGLKNGGILSKQLYDEWEDGTADGSDPILAEKSGKQWLIVTGWPNVGYNWPAPWLEARYSKIRITACVFPGKSSTTLFSPGEPVVLDKKP
jgi:hypothetical protein